MTGRRLHDEACSLFSSLSICVYVLITCHQAETLGFLLL